MCGMRRGVNVPRQYLYLVGLAETITTEYELVVWAGAIRGRCNNEKMCGRVTLRESTAKKLADYFGIIFEEHFTARYNIAPTQRICAVRVSDAGKRELAALHWGIVPSWNPKPIINVRCETVDTKATFKDAFKKRRCLLPVDGFYEWQNIGRKRQPYHIRMKDDNLFALGGLWQPRNAMAGEEIDSCAILTTDANEIVRPLHDRMPVIIGQAAFANWLDHSQPLVAIKVLMRPYPAKAMVSIPVSSWVNTAAHEGEQCLAPPEPAERTLFE